MDADDHELMAACARGDAEAFEKLLSRWQGRVTRVLSRLVASQVDVEDLRQEAFMRVLTASQRYKANGQFSTWLYRIVINLARDAARRRKRTPQQLADNNVATRNSSPDTEAGQRELADEVDAALAALPVKFREVLVLKHYGELTFAEIAAALGEPASTIKSRARSALTQLHAGLKRRGIHRSELES